MVPKKIDDASQRLETYAKTLLNHLTSESSNYSEIKAILNEESDASTPLKAERASLCLREIQQDIEEIKAAYDDLQSAIAG
jgi:hypothetical protein